MSGARHRRKGDRCEREIVALHLGIGIHAERVPLSGATAYAGRQGSDVDLYLNGKDAAPIVSEVKSRKNGAGFIQIESRLGENDCLFLRRNNSDLLVVLPSRVWAALIGKAGAP